MEVGRKKSIRLLLHRFFLGTSRTVDRGGSTIRSGEGLFAHRKYALPQAAGAATEPQQARRGRGA